LERPCFYLFCFFTAGRKAVLEARGSGEKEPSSVGKKAAEYEEEVVNYDDYEDDVVPSTPTAPTVPAESSSATCSNSVSNDDDDIPLDEF
jgi:hypothetical protein